MSSPDNALWQQCWREGQTEDFHQRTVNPLLIRYWSSLRLRPGSPVFVPLCGRSLDLRWLAEQGHTVIGVELSPVAVRDFFRKQRLSPRRTISGALTMWEQGPYRIFCGDLFALMPEQLGEVAAVYDRAALTALPEETRPAYVAHLHRLLPESCPVFLLTQEDAEDDEPESRFPEILAEIVSLYGSRFAIDLAHAESSFEALAEGEDASPRRVEQRLYRLLPY